MSITLNNLACELMNWCISDRAKATNYSWQNEHHVMDEFVGYLNEKTSIKAAKGMPVLKVQNTNHLFLYNAEDQSSSGIIAEFIYDGDKEVDQLLELVNDTHNKFSNDNIEESFQSSIRCIVSVYNDLSNRRKFHDNEFIEVFNDFGVGCAIKRLQ